MPSIKTSRSMHRLALGAVSAGGLLLTVAAGHAQEGNFFDMLFGAPRSASVQPAYNPYADQYRARADRRRLRSNHVREQRVKTRYAALPRTDDDKILGKQPVDQKAIQDDPKGVLLRDHTLRAGDIVVMPSGPKVFTGVEAKTHRIGEFEDVKHSRFVDRKTRAQLVAMMVPVGAMTPEQARKVMSVKLKLAPPDEVRAVEAASATTLSEARSEPATPRVIAPWTAAKP